MSRLVSLCDWLPPDYGAVGQYAALEARRRAEQGDEVTLVGTTTGRAGQTVESAGEGRLSTIRVRRPMLDRGRWLRRALWTAATNTRLVWAARRAARRADEILFTGSPPFLIHWLVPANLLFRRRLAYRISDFHPECLIAELGRAPLPIRWLLAWTRVLRRRIDRFEVLGEDQKRRLVSSGVLPERISVVELGSPVEIPPETKPSPRPESLAGCAVLLYSGNFGVAHDDATLIEGLRLHHTNGRRRTGLWLNATGGKSAHVESRLNQLGVPVHRSEPVPLTELPRLLVAPDLHLITLRDEFVGYVLPSKVWGCIESRKPILFVGSAESDVHSLCSERVAPGNYERVDVGDANGFARALERLLP